MVVYDNTDSEDLTSYDALAYKLEGSTWHKVQDYIFDDDQFVPWLVAYGYYGMAYNQSCLQGAEREGR